MSDLILILKTTLWEESHNFADKQTEVQKLSKAPLVASDGLKI